VARDQHQKANQPSGGNANKPLSIRHNGGAIERQFKRLRLPNHSATDTSSLPRPSGVASMIRPCLATSMATLACASAMLTAAEAADLSAPSRVDAVIVYPAGAEIARTLKVKVEPGEHAVIINDLPAGALPQSIRVEGKSTGGQLQIGSVDSRRLSVPRADSAAIAGQRRDLEDRIEKLRDQRLVLQSDISDVISAFCASCCNPTSRRQRRRRR
jgi:N-terminal domain of unknown function (DUF4140)